MALAVYAGFRMLSNGPGTADVGDCLIEAASAEDMTTVDCADATATYKVVGTVWKVSGNVWMAATPPSPFLDGGAMVGYPHAPVPPP